MKKIILFGIIALTACSKNDLLKPTEEDISVIIDGDTVKLRYDKTKIYKSKYSGDIIVGDTIYIPTINKIFKQKMDSKNEAIIKKGIDDLDLIGKPIRLIATGGFGRYNGYNNESMAIGLPNLVAQQMGIDFNMPLFEPSDFNGMNAMVPTNLNPTGGPMPKFKLAKNNLGVDFVDEKGNAVLKKYLGKRVDDFTGLLTTGYHQSDGSEYKRLGYGGQKYEQTILKEKFDFLLDISSNGEFEMQKGLEGYVPRRSDLSLGATVYLSSRLDMFSDIIKRKNVKGLIINTNGSILLSKQVISADLVRKELNKYQLGYLLDPNVKYLTLNSKIDSLLSPYVNPALKPYVRNKEKFNIYGTSMTFEETYLNRYDIPQRSALSKQLGWPELDVNYILVKIYDGKYTSHDGYKISFDDLFEKNNWSRSKLYHVVFANEALAEINRFYGTTFPLIPTGEFLNP